MSEELKPNRRTPSPAENVLVGIAAGPGYLDFITPNEIFDKGPAAVVQWQAKTCDNLLQKLKQLIALNEPHNGGPYQGFAAAECVSAMTEAKVVIDRFREALEVICDQDVRPYRCAAIARAALSSTEGTEG